MRASFSSRDADNHTAFIRIKTNASNEDEFIILPVEVEVTTGQLQSPCLISCDQYYFVTSVSLCIVSHCASSTWYILLHRDARLWYASVARCVLLTLCLMAKHKVHTNADYRYIFPFFTDRPKLLNLHLLNSGAKDVSIMVGLFVGLTRVSISSINEIWF